MDIWIHYLFYFVDDILKLIDPSNAGRSLNLPQISQKFLQKHATSNSIP